jgi:hypothetical protein
MCRARGGQGGEGVTGGNQKRVCHADVRVPVLFDAARRAAPPTFNTVNRRAVILHRHHFLSLLSSSPLTADAKNRFLKAATTSVRSYRKQPRQRLKHDISTKTFSRHYTLPQALYKMARGIPGEDAETMPSCCSLNSVVLRAILGS